MKRVFLSVCVAALVFSAPARAADGHGARRGETVSVVGFLNGIKEQNSAYCLAHKTEFFASLAKGQTPIATVVTCTDSRVQTGMIDSAPEGRLLIVRNLGNQLATAEGSVEYGIHRLHTPVLLFIGHSRCGVIADVSGNYAKESAAIRRELDTITIAKDQPNLDGVIANVHNQVAAAMLKFGDELKEGKLTVVGAVLDLADDMHQGPGKFNIINVNGETDPAKLASLESLLGKARAGTKQKKKNS